MAALRDICLLLLILLLDNTAWPAISYTHEAIVDDVYLSDEKVGVDVGNVAIRREIGGRKLIAHHNKRIDIKGNGALLEETLMAWNENNQSGNKGKKKKSKVVMMNEGRKPSTSVSHFPRELSNEAGFVAFSADYHASRHHPPKNN